MAHRLIGEVIEDGDIVVDATAGNGHDTLFLARKVGPKGMVYAFDIQEEAILSTRRCLEYHNLLKKVKLIHDGHEKIKSYVKAPVKAVMFNLGYLPSSNKKIITLPTTTIQALDSSLELLLKGGIITLVVYSGHKGGLEEKNAVEKFLSTLDKKKFTVAKYYYLNRDISSPFLLAVSKDTF